MIGKTNAAGRATTPTVIVSSSRNITAADVGCTLQNNWNTALTYTLTQAVSATLDRGAEIAILKAGTAAVTVQGDGVRFGIVGDNLYKSAKVQCPDFLGLIAIKKIAGDATNGDLWVVLGNAEVVT